MVVEDKPKKDYEEFPDAEDEEEITPDHYYDGGKIPVFKPVREPS